MLVEQAGNGCPCGAPAGAVIGTYRCRCGWHGTLPCDKARHYWWREKDCSACGRPLGATLKLEGGSISREYPKSFIAIGWGESEDAAAATVAEAIHVLSEVEARELYEHVVGAVDGDGPLHRLIGRAVLEVRTLDDGRRQTSLHAHGDTWQIMATVKGLPPGREIGARLAGILPSSKRPIGADRLQVGGRVVRIGSLRLWVSRL